MDPRVIAAAIARNVPFERAELLGERDLLFLGETLIAKGHHMVLHEGVVDGAAYRIGERLPEIEPDNFRGEQRR